MQTACQPRNYTPLLRFGSDRARARRHTASSPQQNEGHCLRKPRGHYLEQWTWFRQSYASYTVARSLLRPSNSCCAMESPYRSHPVERSTNNSRRTIREDFYALLPTQPSQSRDAGLRTYGKRRSCPSSVREAELKTKTAYSGSPQQHFRA
jgi:hypothetical protein